MMQVTLRIGALFALLLIAGAGFWLVSNVLILFDKAPVGWDFVFVSVVVGGAVGGFVASLDETEMNKVRLPRIVGDDIQLGTFGNVFVGAVAGLVFFGLFGPEDVIGKLIDQNTSGAGDKSRISAFLRIAGISALAGFAGRTLIQRMAESLSLRDKIANAAREATDAKAAAQKADSRAMYSMGEKAQEQSANSLAVDLFEKAVELDPNNISAKVGLAVALVDVVLAGREERVPAGDKRVERADNLMKEALDEAGTNRAFVLTEQARYEFIKAGCDPSNREDAAIAERVEAARLTPGSLSDYVELARHESPEPNWSQYRKREWKYSRWLKDKNLLPAV